MEVPAGSVVIAELAALEARGAWFELRERLPEARGLPATERLYLEARVAHAFNRCERSNVCIEDALREGVSPELAIGLLRLRYANAMRLGRWGEAFAASEELLAKYGDSIDAEDRADSENMNAIFRALADVPAPEVIARADTVIMPDDAGRIPILVDGVALAFALDTGANLSVMMRSVAEQAGLEIRNVGLVVGTSTGEPALADLAVAEELQLGDVVMTNVVFLVFPDELLTIPNGPRIRGLIGFDVMERLGEVRFLRGGALEIPAIVPEREPANLALDGLEPLVRFEAMGATVVGRLDTGANRTVFYAPFLAKNRERVEALGEPTTTRTAGVGSTIELEVFRMPAMRLSIGGQELTMEGLDVYREGLERVDQGTLDANIGRDLVDRFERAVLNFRSMAFLLE